MEGENGVNGSIINEVDSSGIQGYQMEGESGVAPSIIDEHHSLDMIKWKVKLVLLVESLMNVILRISNEIKLKMKVVLLEVSLMNFILRI